jgi:hypothetical protein
LYRGFPELANLIEGQLQIVLPGRHREDQAELSAGVISAAGIEFRPPEALQQIFDLI